MRNIRIVTSLTYAYIDFFSSLHRISFCKLAMCWLSGRIFEYYSFDQLLGLAETQVFHVIN